MEQEDRKAVVDPEDAKLFVVDKVEFVENEDSKASKLLRESLTLLRQRVRSEIKCTLYKRLLKIVENILLSPWDHQKRRIRETNPVYCQHIANDKQLLDVLTALGFCHIEGFVVLQVVNVPLLRWTYRKLIAMLREEYGAEVRSLEGHFFDPFKAYKHDSDVCKNANKDSFECRGSDLTKQQIEEITRKLADMDTDTSLTSWNPKIHIDNSKGAPKSSGSMRGKDGEDQKHSAAHVMKIYNVGKCDNFESASRKHLDGLKKKYEHLEKKRTVELKIRLPGGTTLMIDPPMKTPVSRLKTEIQSILVGSIALDGWDLVEMPTRRVLDESKTLIQQDISHKVILHFHFKGERKFVPFNVGQMQGKAIRSLSEVKF